MEKDGLAFRSSAMVGSATLAIAPSITAITSPSAMVRIAQWRCGRARPSGAGTEFMSRGDHALRPLPAAMRGPSRVFAEDFLFEPGKAPCGKQRAGGFRRPRTRLCAAAAPPRPSGQNPDISSHWLIMWAGFDGGGAGPNITKKNKNKNRDYAGPGQFGRRDRPSRRFRPPGVGSARPADALGAGDRPRCLLVERR